MPILGNLKLLSTLSANPRMSGFTVDVESVDGVETVGSAPEPGLEIPDEIHAVVPGWVVADDG